jgi:hypothetical protein
MIIAVIRGKIVSLFNPFQKEFSYNWIRNRMIDIVEKRKTNKLVVIKFLELVRFNF